MQLNFRFSFLVTLLLAGGAVDAVRFSIGAAEPASTAAGGNPFAAHNAYPWRLYGKDRFDRALQAGLNHIEVDITFDPKRQAVVATHDSQPNGSETELAALLEPLWAAWGTPSGVERTLIIDLKSSSRELVQGLQAILAPHASVLSSLSKAGGPFQPRQITVCLTGSGDAHREYAALIPADGEYLAFGDLGYGESNWSKDVSAYVPSAEPGFTRFLTFEFHNFLDAPKAQGIEHVSLERLRDTVRLANERGYRMRIYTINPPRRAAGYDTRFWDLCVEAGVHMIATDAYEPARDYWQKHAAAAK